MVKKTFYILLFTITFFALLSLSLYIFIYSKEKQLIIQTTNNFQYNFLIHNKNEQLCTIKKIILNEYNNIKKQYINKEKKYLENRSKDIISLIELLKNSINNNILINQYLNKLSFNAKIYYLNKKIKNQLICNPFNENNECFYIDNSKINFLKYYPSYNILIEVSKNLSDINQYTLNKIINNLKYIPNIVIYYKNKKIKGEFNSNSFYIFEEFKPLHLFFGIGIKYNEIDNLTEKITNEIDKIIKPIMYKIIISFIFLLIVFYIIYFTLIKKIFKKIEKIICHFEQEATYDHLTGVYTRKFFENIATSTNYKNLIIVDLDNFKYVNDTFGHDIGDLVLKELGWNLKQYFKDEPIGRWGGDEFLILSDKSKHEIIKIFKELNSKIHSLQQSFDSSMEKKLSLSVGVCNNKDLIFEEKFKKADLALYKVKKTKKGNILFYSDIDYIKMEKDDLK